MEVPDKLIGINLAGEVHYVSNNHDTIHIWRKLGHGVLRIFDEENSRILPWHMPATSADWLASQTEIEPHERETMTESEMKGYLDYQEKMLDDSWLD